MKLFVLRSEVTSYLPTCTALSILRAVKSNKAIIVLLISRSSDESQGCGHPLESKIYHDISIERVGVAGGCVWTDQDDLKLAFLGGETVFQKSSRHVENM